MLMDKQFYNPEKEMFTLTSVWNVTAFYKTYPKEHNLELAGQLKNSIVSGNIDKKDQEMIQNLKCSWVDLHTASLMHQSSPSS